MLPRPERRWYNGAVRALYPPWGVALVAIASMEYRRTRDSDRVTTAVREQHEQLVNKYKVRLALAHDERMRAAVREIAHLYEEAFGRNVVKLGLHFYGFSRADPRVIAEITIPVDE